MGYSFEFNQRTSESQGIYVQSRPEMPGKKKKLSFLEIGGRDEDAFRWKQYLRKLRDYIGMLLSDRTG